MRYVLAALAALVLIFGSDGMGRSAQAQTIDYGAGWAYSAFLRDDGDLTESNLAAFLEMQVPLDNGTPSGEFDLETGEEIFYPNWYIGLGYTVQGDEDPLSGIFSMGYRRIGNTDLFVGVGGQLEIWDDSIFGKTILAPGARVAFEMVGISDIPLRLTASVTGAEKTNRLEISLTGIR